MKYIYTVTFVPNEDGTKYYCRVPDLLGCITTGSSIDDAIEMITDAASGCNADTLESIREHTPPGAQKMRSLSARKDSTALVTGAILPALKSLPCN